MSRFKATRFRYKLIFWHLLLYYSCAIIQGKPIYAIFSHVLSQRAVQLHYIDKLSNDTVPNHTFITNNRPALFIYNRTKIMG